jgi:hydroxyacylglutathione hydrolase
MRAGAKLLFESLRRFTERCPDWLQLWPGHGAGSACGKSLGAMPQTTLGYEKLTNWAFQIDRDEAFVEAVLDGQPDPPTYFATMKRINRDGPPPLGEFRTPRRLEPDELKGALERKELVVDLRRADEFAGRHVPGTISIPLTRAFAGYAGWVLPYDRDLFLLSGGTDDAAVRQATRELAMIGLDRVAGWFGPEALTSWAEHGDVVTSRQVVPSDVAARMKAGAIVVDVRSLPEWRSGHIAGALHIPLGRLVSQMAERPRSQSVVLVCETGSRSAIGASLLTAAGFTDVTNLIGGVVAWSNAGLPLEVETVVFAHAT